MLSLAVDTSTRAGSLAILRDRTLLSAVATCSSEPHASGLFAELNRVLGALGLQTRDFDLFAAAAGAPGRLRDCEVSA